MTQDLLDADCVITHLCALNIISNRSWKSQQLNNAEADYSVFFDNPNNNGDVRLQIIKRDEDYYVPRSTIKILALRHRINPINILTECAIQTA